MGFLNSKGSTAKNGRAAAGADTAVTMRMEVLIGANTTINGTLKTDGDVRIDGAFEGEIEVLGNVIVGATGRVIASVRATNIHVSGVVQGDVVAQDQLEISQSGKLWGNISAGALHIEPGGVFRGQSAMQSPDEPLLLEAPERTG
ncbi:MAG: polymer-forming cytoskeletal protein [Herpetosiphon sp.]